MKILLVNLPPIFSEGLTRVLSECDSTMEFQSADSVDAARTLLNFRRYHALIVDVEPMITTGLNNIEFLSKHSSACPVVAVASLESPDLMQLLNARGASGFVQKSASPKIFYRVISEVIASKRRPQDRDTAAIAPRIDVSRGSFQTTATRAEKTEAEYTKLTPRQLEVLESLAKGKPNKLIARELHVSENTVKAHLKTVFRVLGVRNRTEAVCHATKMRLVAQ